MVKLLEYSLIDDRSKLLSILEDMVRNDRKLCAIYHGLGETPSKEMQYIGQIIDGALYII